MIRTSPIPRALHAIPPANHLDRRMAELDTALHRLQRSIVQADAAKEKRIRTCEFEQARLDANIEFARSLLTGLEREAMDIRSHSRRVEVQSSLNRKKDVLGMVVDRMNTLKEIGLGDDEEVSEGEDILGPILADLEKKGYKIYSEPLAPEDEEEKAEGAEEKASPEPAKTEPPPEKAAIPIPDPTSQPATQTTQTTQTLRSRSTLSTSTSDLSTTSSHPAPPAHTTARAALFARRKPRAPQSSTATAEALQDRHRAEQDELVAQILRSSSGLKSSVQKFSEKLDDDKTALQKAAHGMDKAETGMDAAGKRMGSLQRMTEGEGWWGRMMLYAWIYGLMVVLVLVVFVLPKIRF